MNKFFNTVSLSLLLLLPAAAPLVAQDSVAVLQQEVRQYQGDERKAMDERLDRAMARLRADVMAGSFVELDREIALGLDWRHPDNKQLFHDAVCAELDDAVMTMIAGASKQGLYLADQSYLWRECLSSPSTKRTAMLVLDAGPPKPWHYDTAWLAIEAGHQALIGRDNYGVLIDEVRDIGPISGLDLSKVRENGKVALRSEAKRGNIASMIFLRNAGVEDSESEEAKATANLYWEGIGMEKAAFQTESISSKGLQSVANFRLRVPETFLARPCSGTRDDLNQVVCHSSPFSLMVEYRGVYTAELIDRMMPGEGDEQRTVVDSEERGMRQTTVTGRKGATWYSVTATGPMVLEAETHQLGVKVFDSIARAEIGATGPLIGWIAILFVIGLIAAYIQAERKAGQEGPPIHFDV